MTGPRPGQTQQQRDAAGGHQPCLRRHDEDVGRQAGQRQLPKVIGQQGQREHLRRQRDEDNLA